jgi:hypothetical protein
METYKRLQISLEQKAIDRAVIELERAEIAMYGTTIARMQTFYIDSLTKDQQLTKVQQLMEGLSLMTDLTSDSTEARMRLSNMIAYILNSMKSVSERLSC